MSNKAVLAYSGGLDTSYCLVNLTKDQAMEVHTVIVNTGGFSDEELKEIETRAYELGLEDFFAVTAESLADGTDVETLTANETFLVPDGNKWKVAATNPEKGTVLQFIRKYDRTAPRVQMVMAQMDKNFKVPTFYNCRVVHHSL